MAGAPSKFTDELFDNICNDVATSEKGLVSICKSKGIASVTFYDWIAKDAELANRYARAKELQAEFMAEQIIEIADESSNDTIVTEKGEFPNNEWINRSRLRVDVRKWVASKLYPKKYGDKTDITTNGQPIVSGKAAIINFDGKNIEILE